MNMKSIFLMIFLKKNVYIEQPASYVRKDQEDKVYKMKKTLYGLK